MSTATAAVRRPIEGGDRRRRLGRHDAARAAYEQALELTANAAERRFLRRRIAEAERAVLS